MQHAFASGQKSKPGVLGNARGAPQRVAAHHGMSNHRVLQRKCACGAPARSVGECTECKATRDGPRVERRALAINKPGDVFEQEADRIAERVMRMAAPQPRRASVGGDSEQQKQHSHAPMQAKHVQATDSTKTAAPPIVHEVLNSPGQPLDAATRAFMEPRFGEDFSAVHVHADSRAAEAASSINARAFTSDRSIVFGAGEHAPQTDPGRWLLAHELTHVVQQQIGVHLKDGLGQPGDIYETHADAVADRIVRGQSAEGLLQRFTGGTRAGAKQQNATGTIQRQPALDKGSNTAKTSWRDANGRSADKSQPATRASATASAGMKSRDEILATIRSLKAQLDAIPKTKEAYKSIARAVALNEMALLDAPIEPTPKRDFIRGPIHFTETYKTFFSDEKNPNFFSFTYQSLNDKAWMKSWTAFYKLATMEMSIVISLCEAILGESDDDRSFDKSGKEKEYKGKTKEFVEEQGKKTPSYFLEYGVARPLEHDVEKYGSEDTKLIAKGAKKLAFAIDAALTAYDIYEANTEGPSLHAAAIETAARIMGRAFNMARGINMTRGQGEFIQHQTHSEVRVARDPLDRIPLPQMKDRRLAYDMVGNRVYEMMMSVLAPKHLASAAAFTKFRDARIENAGNIVDNAGANIVEESKNFGGTMILDVERNVGGTKAHVVEFGQVENEPAVRHARTSLIGEHLGDCGQDRATDFKSHDYPDVSWASATKMALWASLRPLSRGPFRSLVTNLECEIEMDAVLGGLAGAAGHAAFSRFVAGSGGIEPLGPTTRLGAMALTSSSFRATVASVQSEIEMQLAGQASKGKLNASELWMTLPPTYFGFSDGLALKTVVGGTHGRQLFVTDFAGSISARRYSISLRFVLCDNFGVDEKDLYSWGLIPFWILQHERGPASKYRPFVNQLDLPVTVSGAF